MDQKFFESLTAELAALSMATQKALSGIAQLSSDRRAYLASVLEDGLRDLGESKFLSIGAERQEAVLEQALSRYTDIVTGVLT